MNPRRIAAIAALALLIGCETVYFAGQFLAGTYRLRGERAFFRNRLAEGFAAYEGGLSLGGNREELMVDQVELLLFGLSQSESGLKVDLPFPEKEAVRRAHHEVADLARRYPFRAYYWSLASDVYFHEARLRRAELGIDLSTFSEDPIQNLTTHDRLGVASLVLASRLEPRNALYRDLLAEFYLDRGLPERAAVHCTRAVAALPDLDYHSYLLRPDLPGVLVEAAIAGYEEARHAPSILSRPFIDREVGRYLLHHRQDARAVPYLEEALARSPRGEGTRYFLGLAFYRQQQFGRALEFFNAEIHRDPGSAWAHFYAGLTYRALGRVEEALGSFGRAREVEPSQPQFTIVLGEALEQAGRIREAGRLFWAGAKQIPPEIGRWLELLAFYRRQGNQSGAGTVCDQMRAVFPRDPSVAAACDDTPASLR
ncbi:MAG: tetratricopeptide repeat protein [Tepidiformaceae bacterium]